MRSRQKPSLFQSGLVAAASFVLLSGGSMLAADERLPAAPLAPSSEPLAESIAPTATSIAPLAREAAANEIASLPKSPVRTAMQPTDATPIERLSPADLSRCVVLNTRTFGIPFNVDNAGTQPVEVRLFVSRGEGSEWKLLDRKPPTVNEFQFKATDDGRFWFATRTIDAAGNSQPEGHLSPQLRVFIDTTKPGVNLEVEADASGRVVAAFEYHDQTPIKSIQVHYATDVLREWTKLDARNVVASGKINFNPQTEWQQLSLQVIATDAANNRTVTTQLIQRPRIATRKTPDFALIDSHQSNDDKNSIQLVAGENESANAANGIRPNMFVHRASDQRPSIVITRRQKEPEDTGNPQADKSDATPDATIAQVPTFANPNERRSPRPVTNSFFRPNQNGSTRQDGSTQPGSATRYDPRSSDPRSLAMPVPARQNKMPVPARHNNQFSSELAPATTSFGPPSVTQNRKQYQLVQPAPEVQRVPTQPSSLAAAPPTTFAPVGNATNANPTAPSLIDPNAPPIPRGMSMPSSLPAQNSPGAQTTPGAEARTMILPTTPVYRPPGEYPTAPTRPAQSAVAQNPGSHSSGAISLPPASTPDQISNGFGGLNMPNGRQTFTGVPQNETQSPPKPPTELSIDREPEKPRASRTVAEAMRPLEPQPANDRRDVSATSKPQQKATDVDSPAYRAMRQSQAAYDQAMLADRAVVRFSESERFSLEYELEAVGAGGAESVELYGSTDAGQTWKRWGNDPDLVSPFDIETKGEGTFAFKIVVISRNGLASPRPLAGESPDIVVVVDKSKPDVKITDVKYGEGERTGSLVIRYDCKDANLMQRPIALSFSDSPDGPWTTIAAGLRNEGDYVWPGDPELPRQIYLRIDAKDRAGNSGSYLLAEPIDSQGLAPRARIRGFRSLSDRGNPQSQDQTAGRPNGSFK